MAEKRRGWIRWRVACGVGAAALFFAGSASLAWHHRQLVALTQSMARSASVAPRPLLGPFVVVGSLVRPGMRLDTVTARLQPLRAFVSATQWHTDGTRVVQELRLPLAWTFDEAVFIEYRRGVVTDVDAGDYWNYWIHKHWPITEQQAERLLGRTSANRGNGQHSA